MTRIWRWALAYFRLSDRAVCEESRGRGYYDDCHDYHDSTYAEPWHNYIHTCRRCGKRFCI
jgi:hypothetical protein